MAVLVLAYPDSKFKQWINWLGIQWMMLQPRETLAVNNSFWSGLTFNNLYSVFSAAEPREAKITPLADYS